MSAHHFRTPEGIAMAHEQRGEQGPALVWVHGWTGFRQDFEPQWDAFAKRARVYVPDLRGHGASAQLGDPTAYSFASIQADLLAFIDGVVGEPCHLLGHSMGGMVSLRLTLEAPDRVRSLVLMDTAHGPLTHVDLKSVALGGLIAREQGMEVLRGALRARAKDDAHRSEADRRLEASWGTENFWAWRDARIRAMDPHAYEVLVHAMVHQEELEPRLAEVRVPTLVCCGNEDTPFVAPSETMAREIPGATLAMIGGAGHQPQLEAPEAWRDAIETHLERAGAYEAD